MLLVCISTSWADAVPVSDAGLEWQLLGRGVARVQTPAGIGTGFLISNSCMLTSARLMEDVQADQIEIFFTDPLADEPTVSGNVTAPPAQDRWRAISIALAPIDACESCAVLQLAPKAGLLPGETYGFLGARKEDPLPGEPVYIISYAPDARKIYERADAIYASAAGKLSTGGPLSFHYQLGEEMQGDGAPVFGEGGCLVGLQCMSGHGQATAVSINYLRQVMPEGGCPLEVCNLAVEFEYNLEGFGGTPKRLGGGYSARGSDGYFGGGGGGGGSNGGAISGLRGRNPGRFDYPDQPPGYREPNPLPPRANPPEEPRPAPAPPDEPDPPRPDPTPEPTSLTLLLVGLMLAGRRGRG